MQHAAQLLQLRLHGCFIVGMGVLPVLIVEANGLQGNGFDARVDPMRQLDATLVVKVLRFA